MACKNGVCSKKKGKKMPVPQPAPVQVPQQQSPLQPQYPTMQPGYQNPLIAQAQQQMPQQQPQGWWDYIKSLPGNIWQWNKEAALGTPGSLQEYTPYQPHQLQALDYLLGSGLQNYANPYQGFEPIAQQALDQFYQGIVPQLSERFTATTNGALSSPAFAGQLGGAGAGLVSQLAAHKAQYGLQNRQQALGAVGMGLTPQSSFVQIPGTPGYLAPLVSAGTKAAGAYYGGLI